MRFSRNVIILALWTILLIVSSQAEWSFTPVLPSLCALTLVFVFRSALMGLAGGALAGAVLLAPSAWLAPLFLLDDLLLPALQSRWNLCVLMFTLIMGGFVGLLNGGGGVSALVNRLTTGAKHTSRRMEWITYGLGFGCFFDGLANSMLVGSTMRPVYDRTGSPRNRLAYIVDSTSSPVACVALLSTWIAYQLSMIKEGLSAAEMDVNPYSMFLAALPGNYYCWFTLILVAIVIHRRWDLASTVATTSTKNSKNSRIADKGATITEDSQQNHHSTHTAGLHTVWIPLLFLLVMLPTSLWWSGSQALAEETGQMNSRWIDTFAAADTALMLVFTGLSTCLVATLVYPRSAPTSYGKAFLGGMERMLAPTLILIAAWALSGSLKQLDAGIWIGQLLSGTVPAWFLPGLVFIAAAAISFLTGTSWGTMGIVIPLVIPLANSMDSSDIVAFSSYGTYHLCVSVLAAAFSGAVFGDHCSPISDTTIVSSLASGIEPFEHVRTQMPYALVAAGLALFPGFILAGLTGQLWPGLLAGLLGLAILWFLLGKRRKQEKESSTH
jgi:Na+/H+ antiporter NhaC